MDLPKPIAERIRPLLDALPLDRAMDQLVVTQGVPGELIAIVQAAVSSAEIAARPPLCAGLWLYVDELNHSHRISQNMGDATGSFWHAIMHRREGDFGNSHYWFNRAGKHPAMAAVDGYDAHRFVDDVEAIHARSPAPLIGLQRREWAALFAWCARQPA